MIGKHFSSTPGGVSSIFSSQKGLRDNFTTSVEYEVEILDTNGVVVQKFNNGRVVSIDFEEGRYVHYGNFIVTIECHEFPGAEKLLDFNHEVSLESSEGMGYIQDSKVVTDSIIIGTETVSGTGNTLEDSKSKIKTYLLANDDIVEVLTDSTKTYVVKKVKPTASSTNVSTGAASISQTFYLVPDDCHDKIIGSMSTEVSRTNSAISTVTISGEIKLIDDNATLYDEFETIQDLLYDFALEAQLKDEESIRNALSPLTNSDRTKHGSAVSQTVTENKTTNTLTYSYQFEISNTYAITNAIYERVTVTTSPRREAVAVIPVIGKGNGPLLQGTGSFTENTRNLNLEVIFAPGKDHGSESSSIDQLILDNEPQETVLFVTNKTESFNEQDRRYVMDISWIYNEDQNEAGENAVLQDIPPSTPNDPEEDSGPLSDFEGYIWLPRINEAYYDGYEVSANSTAPNPTTFSIEDLFTYNLQQRWWKFNADDPKSFHYLKDGENLIYTFKFKTPSRNSQKYPDILQKVVILIRGSDDAPIFDGEGHEEEVDADSANASDSFDIYDPDNDETLTVNEDDISVTCYGNTGELTNDDLKNFLTTNVSGSQGEWTLTWNFNAPADDLKYLKMDEILTIFYSIPIKDNSEKMSKRTVKITITGVDNPPIMTLEPTSISITESNFPFSEEGTISIEEAEPKTTLVFKVQSATSSSGNINQDKLKKMISFAPRAVRYKTSYEVKYIFNSLDERFDYLKDGDTETITFTIECKNSNDTTVTEDLTVDITGSNDGLAFVLDYDRDDLDHDISENNIVETSPGASETGTLMVLDYDEGDVTTLVVTVEELSGWLRYDVEQELDRTTSDVDGLLTLGSSSITHSGGNVPEEITWTFNPGSVFDYLTDGGQGANVTYKIKATSSGGGDEAEIYIVFAIKADVPSA